MNKKERRKALFCVLSSKFKSKELILVDKIEFKDIKTKSMVKVIKTLPYEKNILLAIPSKNEVVEKSASNLPYMKSILVDYLNIKDLLKYKTLVLLKDSLVNLDRLV
ncbi:MAG: 50S ribosomal protein L4 [Candidatus Peribacteria bacterium]|jgi:large subunit ribosomal protein L4|nr:50S ribosomal protein L4 [Candidatus Peribacteria bacterium]